MRDFKGRVLWRDAALHSARRIARSLLNCCHTSYGFCLHARLPAACAVRTATANKSAPPPRFGFLPRRNAAPATYNYVRVLPGFYLTPHTLPFCRTWDHGDLYWHDLLHARHIGYWLVSPAPYLRSHCSGCHLRTNAFPYHRTFAPHARMDVSMPRFVRSVTCYRFLHHAAHFCLPYTAHRFKTGYTFTVLFCTGAWVPPARSLYIFGFMPFYTAYLPATRSVAIPTIPRSVDLRFHADVLRLRHRSALPPITPPPFDLFYYCI